ncbi:aspartate aminotransferase family protein [Candidatus Entotheonella palauensis]|uniref:aspartate aminotransferase family protein n=1 Tax=Candidatus Entotheonella palauensis TaxID=93172 RepID=UPI000B7EBBF8|nr:aminotransferase class III-fold pyridoxal phosphate-dependent enzyme [Candidatus Entotheonella palauensis]
MPLSRNRHHQALVDKAQQYFPGGSNGNGPLSPEHGFVIASGQGAHVYDPEGRAWLDYLLGSGPMILGHGHPEVVEAVREQLDKGTTFFFLNDKAIELAEAIVEAMPCAEQVRYTSTGSEATFFALRLARAYRGRDKILKFEGGYNGSHDYAMMSTEGTPIRPYPQPRRGSAGIPKSLENEVLIAPFNDLEQTTAIIEAHHDELAAVIVEPFQRALTPVAGFLQGVRALTDKYGLPLIFDEVVTGFRFAYGGAQEHYGVTPDLASVGKIVGGGYPLAAVVGKKEFMAPFVTPDADGMVVGQVGTLNGNPIAAAAGLATLRVLRQPGSYERLHAVGQQVREQLTATLREHGVAGQVIGDGPIFQLIFNERDSVHTYRDTLDHDTDKNRIFHDALLQNGILKSASKGYISLVHSDEDLEETAQVFDKAMAEVAKASTGGQ